MARKSATENSEPTQAEPTKPRELDANGRPVDGHGLPLNGPARARRLAELDIADPALATEAPATAPLPPAGDVPPSQE